MKQRTLAEAVFKVGLFILIVAIGFGVGELLKPFGTTLARLIGSATTTALTMTVLLNWSRLLEHFWPRSPE